LVTIPKKLLGLEGKIKEDWARLAFESVDYSKP